MTQMDFPPAAPNHQGSPPPPAPSAHQAPPPPPLASPNAGGFPAPAMGATAPKKNSTAKIVVLVLSAGFFGLFLLAVISIFALRTLGTTVEEELVADVPVEDEFVAGLPFEEELVVDVPVEDEPVAVPSEEELVVDVPVEDGPVDVPVEDDVVDGLPVETFTAPVDSTAFEQVDGTYAIAVPATWNRVPSSQTGGAVLWVLDEFSTSQFTANVNVGGSRVGPTATLEQLVAVEIERARAVIDDVRVLDEGNRNLDGTVVRYVELTGSIDGDDFYFYMVMHLEGDFASQAALAVPLEFAEDAREAYGEAILSIRSTPTVS